jgi:hypothetical protein
MLTFNGKRFAATEGEMLETLFTGPTTASGFYKVRSGRKTDRVAVEFFDHLQKPVALVSPDGALVTAYRLDGDKQTIYMYGCTAETEAFMGTAGMTYGDIHRLTAEILTAARSTK